MLRITRSLIWSLTLSAFALMAFFVSSVSAQQGSSVRGTVTDGTGAVVAGATVKLISDEKGFSRTVTTNSDGGYSFESVPPDKYRIEIEAPNFKKLVISNIAALVDKPTEANATLEAGNISEVVNVSGGDIASIVNTQDGSLGNNFVARQIQQLPLEGRNVVDLLSLQPGVTRDGSVNGGRRDQANITLDGVDVNDQETGLDLNATAAFASVLRVTPDSIEEFRVTTSNPDATKGRSAGAQVSLITKSGSNDWHGNLFEYHRNTLTTANDWYNNSSGVDRPKLIRNLYGGSLGGPIKKDRLFFFYNYEGMREAKDTPVNTLVPLPSLGQGIIKFFDDSGVLRSLNMTDVNGLVDSNGDPVVNENPIALGILASAAARYHANAAGGDDINTGGFRFNAPLPVRQNTHTARFDYAITRNQKHSLTVRANLQQDLFGGAPAFPDTPSADTWSHPKGLAAAYTWLISNTKTNRFTYGYTRLAYSAQGDASENAISFRNVYSPLNFTNTATRVNPTHNFTDDFTWTKGNHTFQFGTNIRIIRNTRTSLGSAFDNGVANFGYYENSGDVLLDPLNVYLTAHYGTNVDSAWINSAQSSLTAVLGRLSQYTANFVFDINGNPVSGEPTVRTWATEEYDWYVQDSWKLKQNLTLNLGLRYGLSRPVYETHGFQAAPNIPLDVYFQRRLDAAFNGQNYDEALIVDLAGPKNHKPGFYEWDKNNFQPRVSAAWSPSFSHGFLKKLFGSNQESVIRGGFAITNDYFGQQMAVSFDANNTLGFVSSYTTPPNTYNITTNPAPPITGLGMDIRSLPGVVTPGHLTFPLQRDQDLSLQIEQSIDRGVVSPINYSWNFTFGRQLPGKMYIEASYVARLARHLLATRDVMSPNNIRDPLSGQTWYEAATILEQERRAGVPIGSIANLPFFEHLYAPGSLGPIFYGDGRSNTQTVYSMAGDYFGGTDWTTGQLYLDAFSGKQLFFQSQYGALSSFGTIAQSNYHGATFSLRQRLSTLTWDLNYTWSHSLDDTSGLQVASAYGSAFILNPIRQHDNYSSSDFDMRHIINFSSVWQLPFGTGRRFLNSGNSLVNGIIGGWQLSTIARYNSGEPIGTLNKYFDNAGWVTNWNLKSAVVQTAPIQTGVFFNGTGGLPTMFADPQAAYHSFRSPFPGETGDRNKIRFPAYYVIDMGLQKQFNLPWKENHRIAIKWEIFNLTNTPIFTGINETRVGYRPETRNVPIGFGEFTQTKSNARVMQFALRYDF
jgi:hypothetical protein